MTETTRHREAFDAYWRLDAERSVERLHEVLTGERKAPTLRTLYEWSKRYRWQDRLAQLERKAKQADDEARLEGLREMHERQAKEWLLLQQRGAEWLAHMPKDKATAEAAIRAIVEGSPLERLARGESTERQEVQGEIQISARLTALADDELDRLIEHAEGTLG